MKQPYLTPFIFLVLGASALTGRKVFAQQPATVRHRTTPAAAAVSAAKPAPALTVKPADDADNEPSPPVDKSTETVAGTPQVTETEILATDGATFASKDRIAVFTGDVRVTDPRFQLACEKLTVFLNKSASNAMPGAAPTPADVKSMPPGPEASPTPGSSGGIDHAVAEGHVIIVQERAATQGGEAKRSVGRADWANFDNKSGDMVLKGMPSVEQNENTHVATSPNTIMTLRKDNSLMTVGPSRTIIKQRKNDLPASSPSPSPAIAADR